MMFEILSETFGVAIDQVRYLVLFFISFPLAIILRSILHYSYTSTTTRHWYCIVIGVLFGWICFNWQVIYLIGFALFGYLLLFVFPPQTVGWYTSVYALSGVTLGHVYRMITDYGGYTLDFTGPLMVMVQRVTYVAYAYHDGVSREDRDLNEDQKKLKINARPSLLQYFSYNFNFMTLMAGPTAPYKEYDNFITGRNFTNTEKYSDITPNPFWSTVKKFSFAVLFLALYSSLMAYEKTDLVLDPDLSLPRRLLNTAFLSFPFRCRYYFTFLIVEAISNAGGFGFNGYTQDGEEKWDLVQMISIRHTEFMSSARDVMISWNQTTHAWLKRIYYERSNNSVLVTNIVGAIWHGLYPVYFLVYVIGFLTIQSGRKWHNLKFLSSYSSSHPVKILYNIFSFIILSLLRDFLFVTFSLLLIKDVLSFWRYFYFAPIIVMLLMVIVLPAGKGQKKKET